MPSQLLTTREDSTLILTLSDPATRNTLSPQVYLAGVEALNTAADDASVRTVLLRGDGLHFCAGGDLQRISTARLGAPQAQSDAVTQFNLLVDALRHFPKPVIAAVEGYAAGGGMSLALACDLIVASEDAKFVLSYAKLGLSPDGGASWHLAQQLPRAQVLELLWLAEPATARQLQQWGLINRVCPPGQAREHALALASQLARMAPNALASVKDLIQRAPGRSLTQHMEAERQAFVENLFHDNAGEGLAAFLAKRPAAFR